MRRSSSYRRRSTGRRSTSRSTSKTRARNSRRTYRNRRKFNFRRMVRPLLVMFAVAGLTAACYTVLTTPKLQVTKVRVMGTKLLSRSVVEADANSALGKNILVLPRSRMAALIKKKHPQIADVKVGRVLPDTVLVRVQERAPYVTAANGSGFWLVDKSGFPFHRIEKPWKSIPIVELPDAVVVKATNSKLLSAIQCVDDGDVLGRKITKISVDPAGNVCLNIGSDFYVKLGQPVEVPEKLKTLSTILTRSEIGKNARYIDVSCNEAPVWMPKSEEDERPVPGG